MPFVHLPIQSGSDRILKLMNRKHKVEDYLDIYKNFIIQPQHKNSVILVGNFDGIHLGHQDIISHIVEFGKKHNIPSCVITFDPNPYYVLRNENKPINIQSVESKLNSLEKMGVDKVLVIPFTEQFSKVTAAEFAINIIKDIFNPKLIAVGTNHHFGFNKEGDIEFITDFCDKNNIDLLNSGYGILNLIKENLIISFG